MKTYIILVFLLIPTALIAADPSDMTQGNMQDMMQVMQEVQQCMEKIDQSKLNELQIRSEKLKEEVDKLCAQGEKDKAQKRAIALGKEIASDPTIQQMSKCGEMAQGALPMMGNVNTYDEKEYANRHVCDE